MAIAAYNSTFYVGSLPSVAFTDEATTTSDRITYSISNAAHRYLDKSVATVVQTSPDGSTWTTVTSGFTLYRCNARVVFTSTQPIGTQVRLHSGNYIPYASLAQSYSADYSAKMDMLDSTVFNSTGNKTFVPGLLSGTMKCQTWWANETRITSLLARDLIIVSIATPTGNHYDGFCYAGDLGMKADPKSLVTEDITFQLTDELFAA